MAIHGFPGGVISATAPTVSPSSASGVWTLDDQLQNSANWPTTNVTLSNSVRLRSSAGAYMARTPTVAGSKTTWTFSCWFKRGSLTNSANQTLLFASGGSAEDGIRIIGTAGSPDQDKIGFYIYNGAYVAGNFTTTQVFRDPSAWYHLVWVWDSTNATSTDRIRLYINGQRVTSFSESTYPALNAQCGAINNTYQHEIGRQTNATTRLYDGYMADVNFVDGRALDPSYFGATNPNTGVWQPSQYKGTYGTNGFYLPMNIEVLLKSFTKSLRFRASANPSLTRTPASVGNRALWTWSGWVKRGVLGTFQTLFGTQADGSNIGYISFDSDNKLDLNNKLSDTTGVEGNSTRVFRDPSAWYHLVIVFDGNQASQSNRFAIYVNGVQDTFVPRGSKTAGNGYLNSAVSHAVGNLGIQNNAPIDGYLAEVNFIDGLALTPGYFGQTDTTSGAWQPVAYTGQYGTNGYYLPFTNTTSTAALGFDASGRNNNFTTNNISLTAGATYDSMTDVPTLTSATEANYCVFNPLAVSAASSTISNGNLTVVTPNVGGNAFGTFEIPATGKYYFEITPTANNFSFIGISAYTPSNTYLWQNSNHVFYNYDGLKYVDGTSSAYGASYTLNDVIGVACDSDASTITFYKNNVSQGAISHTMVGMFPALTDGTSGGGTTYQANFGQRPFAYTPPTGFVALNTFNL